MQDNLLPVIVVGGGLAGLCAAYELRLRGISNLVLEGRPRLGGRVQTIAVGQDFHFDGGGELIGSNHRCWLDYARRFKLDIVESGFYAGTAVVMGNGEVLSAHAVKQIDQDLSYACEEFSREASLVSCDEPWLSVNADAWDTLSVGGRIASLEISDLSKKILVAELETGNGVPIDAQSYLALLAQISGGGLKEFWADTARWRCITGAGALSRAFHQQLDPQSVLLNSAVHTIDSTNTSLKVTCHNGQVYSARNVLVAVPPSVLHKINFLPFFSLPSDLQMGGAIKSMAEVCGPLPADLRGYGDGLLATTWTVAHSQEHSTFACLSGGPAADVLRASGAVKPTLAKQLGDFFPAHSISVAQQHVWDWSNEPWIEGSYSFPAPGEVTRVRDFWSRNRGPLFFAGEHTDHAFVGFMEGALRSGIRAAGRIATKYLKAA